MRAPPSPGQRRCTAELTAWTTGLRPRAAALLCVMLVFLESKSAAHTAELLPALWTALQDEDAAVRARVAGAARLLGRFVHADAWVQQLRERLGDDGIDARARAASVALAANLLEGAQGRLGDDIAHSLMATLEAPALCASSEPVVRAAVLAALRALLDAASPDAARALSAPGALHKPRTCPRARLTLPPYPPAQGWPPCCECSRCRQPRRRLRQLQPWLQQAQRLREQRRLLAATGVTWLWLWLRIAPACCAPRRRRRARGAASRGKAATRSA